MDPYDNPTPKPESTINEPLLSFLFLIASFIAIGIVAETVLPRSCMFIKVFDLLILSDLRIESKVNLLA